MYEWYERLSWELEKIESRWGNMKIWWVKNHKFVVGSVETAIFEWLEGFCCMVPYLNSNTLPWTRSKLAASKFPREYSQDITVSIPFQHRFNLERVPSRSRVAAIETSEKNDPNGIQPIYPSSTPPANDEARIGEANKNPSPQWWRIGFVRDFLGWFRMGMLRDKQLKYGISKWINIWIDTNHHLESLKHSKRNLQETMVFPFMNWGVPAVSFCCSPIWSMCARSATDSCYTVIMSYNEL